jgi:hypothetical protein
VVIDVSNSTSFEATAVGSERLPESGYFRAKMAQEKLIREFVDPVLDRACDAVLRSVRSIADAAIDGSTSG